MTSAEWAARADADRPATQQPATQQPAGPDPAVADLAELDTLVQRPLSEHADVFARVHAQLQAALADVEGS